MKKYLKLIMISLMILGTLGCSKEEVEETIEKDSAIGFYISEVKRTDTMYVTNENGELSFEIEGMKACYVNEEGEIRSYIDSYLLNDEDGSMGIDGDFITLDQTFELNCSNSDKILYVYNIYQKEDGTIYMELSSNNTNTYQIQSAIENNEGRTSKCDLSLIINFITLPDLYTIDLLDEEGISIVSYQYKYDELPKMLSAQAACTSILLKGYVENQVVYEKEYSFDSSGIYIYTYQEDGSDYVTYHNIAVAKSL